MKIIERHPAYQNKQLTLYSIDDGRYIIGRGGSVPQDRAKIYINQEFVEFYGRAGYLLLITGS